MQIVTETLQWLICLLITHANTKVSQTFFIFLQPVTLDKFMKYNSQPGCTVCMYRNTLAVNRDFIEIFHQQNKVFVPD